MTMMQAYWLTRLDCISYMFLGLSVFFGCIGFFGLVVLFDEGNEHRLTALKMYFLIEIILILIAVLTPTTKEAAFIVLAPKITNSKFVQEIPEDMLEVKNLAMEYIKDNLKSKGSK